jgi:hypothetical protein
METANTRTAIVDCRQIDFNRFAPDIRERSDDDKLTEKRLSDLLALNAETERQKSLFRNERERTEAALMTAPLSVEKTFAYFGLLLGVFPPAAFFAKFLIDTRSLQSDNFWILGVVLLVNLIAAGVGFLSGKFIGRTVAELERASWTRMILGLPFVGAFWGILAGGASGAIIFLFGAFFGAALGATVGAFALPLFAVFHRLLRRGDSIDGKHFLPLAFGISFIVSAFILGL